MRAQTPKFRSSAGFTRLSRKQKKRRKAWARHWAHVLLMPRLNSVFKRVYAEKIAVAVPHFHILFPDVGNAVETPSSRL